QGAVNTGGILIGRPHASGHEEFAVARKRQAAHTAPFIFRRQFISRECLAVKSSRGRLVVKLARSRIPDADGTGPITRGQAFGVRTESNAVDRVPPPKKCSRGMAAGQLSCKDDGGGI